MIKVILIFVLVFMQSLAFANGHTAKNTLKTLGLKPLDGIGVKNIEAYLFDQNDTGPRKGKRTDSALILRNGKILFERYARGFDGNKKHIMWSTSKTAMALLVGVAERDGRAKRTQSICEFLKDTRKELCKIRIQDLMQWSSALNWVEEYENAKTPRVSSVLAMLYGEGRNDMAKFVLSQDLEKGQEPGQMWRYSSGDSIVLAAVLKEIYHDKDLRQIYHDELFKPLGMKDWLWEADPAGTLSGAYYFFVSTHDLANLGKIFIGQGTVEGKKIVEAEFIKFLETVPEAFNKDRREHAYSKNISGAHLWLNKPEGTGLAKPWPSAPEDTVVTLGHWGQFLIVIPSMNLIAVRTGDNRDHTFAVDTFVELIMQAVSGDIRPVEIVKWAPVKKEDKDNRKLYKDGIIDLGLRFTAHAFCSCLFVTENTEEACRDYASLEQVSPRLTVDHEKKTTKASLFFIFSEEAQYLGPEKGCILK